MRQTYGTRDDRQHIRWLARAFQDRRYIRVGDRPLVLIYRTRHLPNALRTSTIWREEAKRLGVGELYLCSVESLPQDRLDPTRIGFDAAVEFQPDWNHLGVPSATIGDSRLFDYATTVERMLAKPDAPYLRYPCVTPGWDNSPRRRESAVVLSNSSPELYRRWLETAIARMRAPSADENLVFVNAWNEWGEGAHLEPSAKWGRAYLEATRAVIGRASVPVWTPPTRPIHARIPRVTVSLPTYNGAAHVEAAIESILSQTLDDFELLVMDDCSDDDTPAIVARFQDARIRFERNPVRFGLVRNWNRCLDAASGTYVTIFHQDDVMAPDNLARKVAVLDEHPTVAFVHSNLRQIGPDGSVLSEWWYAPPAPGDAGVHGGRDFLERLFWGDNLVCCPGVVLRREMVSQHGLFDTQLPFTADWEMWMRLCIFHDVAYIPDPLFSYRRHPGAETERFKGASGLEQSFLAKHRILVNYGQYLPAADWHTRLVEGYEEDAVRMACVAMEQGETLAARELLSLAASVRGYGPGEEYVDLSRTIDLLVQLHSVGASSGVGQRSLGDGDWDALRRRCQDLEAEIRALKSSGSWKITSPVRALVRILTGRPA
jgi:glycosyltransferase involved in cell wall biosynthesis